MRGANSRKVSERINRYLARRGVASRREADELIAAGRVLVNGHVAETGKQIDEGDVVTVDGRPIAKDLPTATTILLNKPPGYVTTVSDPHAKATVMELLPQIPGLVPVGRLDKETRGLLLFTTDGDLAFRITHPRFGIARRYQVWLLKPLSQHDEEQLLGGVQLEDGFASVASLNRLSPRQLEVEMLEGRKREVRRLFAQTGNQIVDLVRVAFGPLRLGNLKEGSWRALTLAEVAHVYGAVGLPVPDLPSAGTKRDPSRHEAADNR